MPIPQYTLKTVDVKPIVFTPTEYKQNVYDPKPFQQAVQIQEARTERAIGQQNGIITTLNNIAENLDESERQWFYDTYANPINSKLEDYFNQGKTETLIHEAGKFGQNLAKDITLNNIQRYNKQRETARNAVRNNAAINETTKLLWDYRNDYNKNKARTSGEFEAIWNPENDITLDKIPTLAAQLTEYISTDWSSNSKTSDKKWLDADGNVIDPKNIKKYDGTPEDENRTAPARLAIESINTSNSSQTRRTKSVDMINATMNALLKDEKFNNQMLQMFDANRYAYDYYNEQLENEDLTPGEKDAIISKLSSVHNIILDKNGELIETYNSFLKARLLPIVKQLSYDRLSTANSNTTNEDYGKELLNNNDPDSSVPPLPNPQGSGAGVEHSGGSAGNDGAESANDDTNALNG